MPCNTQQPGSLQKADAATDQKHPHNLTQNWETPTQSLSYWETHTSSLRIGKGRFSTCIFISKRYSFCFERLGTPDKLNFTTHTILQRNEKGKDFHSAPTDWKSQCKSYLGFGKVETNCETMLDAAHAILLRIGIGKDGHPPAFSTGNALNS